MGRRGSALLLTLVAMVGIALALVLYHHQAMQTLRLGQAALASARAREAAGTGIALVAVGGAPSGMGVGTTTWQVHVDTLPGGLRLLWSDGLAVRPAKASLRLVAAVAAGDTTPGAPPLFVRRWVPLRF